MRKFFTLKYALLLCLALISQVHLSAQVIMSSTGSYVQDFNGLAGSGTPAWSDNGTIANWYAQKSLGGAILTYTAGTGSGTAGALYSYGTVAADRALGTIGSNASGDFAYGILLKNTSGSTITNITVSYTLEQWRNGGGGAAQTVGFYFQKSATPITNLQPGVNGAWTPVTALDRTSTVNTGSAAALDGNSNKSSVSNIVLPGLSLANDEYIFLKWEDPNHAGNDHGLAIDDVTINWTVPPSNNANLSALSLKDAGSVVIPFSGSFDPNTTGYNTASPVSNATTPVFISFTKANANASVEARVNSDPYSSSFSSFALNEGPNTIYVRVTAQDLVTQKEYTIGVTRLGVAVPLISATPITAFGNICTGTSAGPNSFTLNGSDLNGSNINIAALAGYSYAEAPGGPYSASLSFAAGSSLGGKTIYVQFNPAAVQSYNGNIIVSGGGAASVSIAVNGNGINTTATAVTGSNIVTGTSASLNGAISANGCSAVTSYGFEYSTTPGFVNGSGTQVTAANLSGGNFSKTVSGLAAGITYYYKAFAVNSGGTAYGTENSFTTSAVVPVVMSAQPLFRYTENFSAIGSWTDNFVSGTGANHFSSVAVNTTGSIPSATRIVTATDQFKSGSSGGVQKGSGSIVLLSTGTSDNTTSTAIDFYMDFTGMNAGSLSFDWATIDNDFHAGDSRKGSFRVYASVDGVNFVELTAADVLNFTNGVPATGTVNSIALPAIFNNSATARLRFYYHNGTGGSGGSRPKISIDNLTVTGVASTPCVTPSAGPTGLSFGTIGETSIQASFTAASPAANEYLVIVSTNSSLTSNPIDGQVYNVGDNVGDGDVVAKGNTLNFTASGLDAATPYYFFIFPLNSVCTGGPLYSVANVLTGTATTAAGLPSCTAPVDQATNFVVSNTGINSIQAFFTAGTGNEYLVLQSTSSSLSGAPVTGQSYNAGTVIGNATVVQRSSSTSFTASGLIPATTYYFYVISLNSQGCVGGPVYNTVSPLTVSVTTQPLPVCATPTAQPINLVLNASNSSVNGSFNGVSGSGYQYLVVRSSSPTLSATPVDNNDYTVGAALGGGVVVANGPVTSFNAAGLSATTTYYFFVFSMDKNCSGGTKYLAASPLTGTITTTNTPPNNIYFGTLHSHSDYSDGNKDHPGYTPTNDYAYALGSDHMDFLGISEHNHFSSLDNPGNELAKYHSGITEAANFTANNPGFLALYGMEWGVISGGGHVVVYGDAMSELFGWESNVNGNVGPNYDVYVPKSVYTGPDGLFKTINDYANKNAFASLAHPNSSDYNNLSNLPYDAQADAAISGTAVESGPATSTNTTYSNPASPMYYLWYYQKMLSKGYHLGPTIDHDNHNTTFGRTTKSRTAVIAPALTQTEILKAVRDMHFYATEDYDTKVDFTVNNRIMGTIFEDLNAPAISVKVTDATTDYSNALIRVLYGVPGSNALPIVIDSVFGSSLNFIDNNLANNATGYYYVDITNGSTRTVTSPVWYTRKCAISTEFTISACESYNWNGTIYTTSVTDTKVFTTTGGCDSTVTMHLTINHNPASAVITAPAGLTGCPGTGVAITGSVNDGGNGAISSYEWSLDGNTIVGANTINLTALQSGSYILKAINAGGCAITAGPLTVTVADNIPPVVQTQNLTVFLDASGNAFVTAAQVDNGSTDNCGIDTRTLSKTSFDCATIGTQTVTLTVKDAAGNMTSGTATITVVDNLKPIVVTQNITVMLGVGGTVTILPSQVNNGSTDNCGIATMVLDKTSFNCANIGANTVKLTVTDVNGNSDFQLATVTVVGTTYVTNTTTLKNFCTIQSAVSDATTLAGHTLEVQPGNYNEQVLVNKGVTIKGVGATKPVVNFTGTATGKKTLFDVSVANVTIDNLNFKVDQTKVNSAVIVSGTSINNVTVRNNKIDAYASSGAAFIGAYGDRNAVSINYSGPTNFRFAGAGGVSNVSFLNNTVSGVPNDGFGIARYFRSGVSADDASGNFNNNTIQSINHDVIVRFGNTGALNINNNIFNGGGVELTDFVAGPNPLTIQANQFNAAFANTAAANTAVLRLKNNFNVRPTIVNGNTLTDAEWGISIENYNNVTVQNNSFTPLAGSTGYHHITINTKTINTNSATIVQKPVGATLLGNTFNGSGVNGGTALGFFNHDNDAAAYGSFVIGSAGNENSFGADIKTFVALDAQSGASGTATFPNYPSVIGTGANAVTTMAPWSASLFMENNRFDAGSGLKLPGAMSNAELFAVEDKIQHKIDASPLGFVLVKVGHDFVTTNSSLAPLTTSASIQRGVDAASNGFTVNVGPGVFTDNVTVNKSVAIEGAGEAATTVIPAVSNPDCGGAGGGSICAGGSNVFLVKADNVRIRRLTIDGNNPAISSATIVDGVDIDARNGIITDHTAGVFNNFTVSNVTVKNIFLRAIYASSGGSFIFSDNTVSNVQGNSSSIGLFNYGGAGQFVNNKVSNTSDAIASNWSKGSVYVGNTVTNSGSGIHTDNNGGSGGTADIIQGNNVSNSKANGYGIWVFAPYVPSLVQGNTVSNVDVGLAAAGQQAAVTPVFQRNTVDGQNKPNSTGVYVTTDLFGFGTSDVSVVFQNNFIRNNADGFYLESQAGKTLNLQAHSNSITGNTNSAVTQGTGDAGAGNFIAGMECNWWGTTNNTVIAAGIHGAAVVYNPRLVNGTDTDPVAPGFQPVPNCADPLTNAVVTSQVNVNCFGASTGAATISFSNGTPGFSYRLDEGAAVSIGTSPFTINNLAAGEHTVVISDADGNTTAVTFTITQPAAPISVNFTFTPIACNGGLSTQNLTVNGGTAPYTVLNQGGGAFVIGAQEGVTYGGTQGNTYAANYIYTVTDAKGCQYVFTGNIPQPPVLTVAASASAIACPGGTTTITVSATGGTAPYNGTGSFNVTAGTYTYTVTDANGCAASVTQTVVVNDSENPVISQVSNPAFCENGSGNYNVPAIIAGDNCGIASITYSISGATTRSGTGADASGAFNVGVSTITWTVTDANNNTTTATATVTINANPAVTPIAGASTVTAGSGTLFTNATVGGVWNSGNTGIATVSATGLVSGVSAGSTTISYTLTTAAGCSTTVSAPITVTPACIAPVITASGVTANTLPNATTCNSPVTYTVTTSGTAPVTLSYVLTGATTGSGSGTGSGVVFNVGITTVKITATNACGTSTTTFTVTLKDGTAPVPVVTTLPTITGQCAVNLAAGNNNSCDDDCRCCRNVCHCRTSNCSCRDADYRYRNIFSYLVNLFYSYYYGDDDENHGCDQADNSNAPKATDNCKGTITATTTDPLSYNSQGTYTIHWKYDDGNGNITMQEQTVIVKDDAKPVIKCPGNITVTCGAATVPSACGSATATDNCGAVSISYTDVTSGTLITRTWKATDAAGNFSTCVQTITIAPAFTVDISSVPTNNTYTGGIPTNLYLGYGAQSTTLQTCSLPSSGAPYTYSWSGTATNRLSSTTSAAPVFSPAGYGSYLFTVTVTNKYGCTSTDYITICVTDIRVPGTNGKKVYVCHQSNGKYKSYQTIEVSINAVPTHIGGNGCGNKDDDDRLGSCDQTPCGYTSLTSVGSGGMKETATQEPGTGIQKTADMEEAIKVTVMPNPSTTYFTLKFESRSNAKMNLRVMDGSGRVVDARSSIVPNSSLQIGHNYSSGTYYAEVIQGGQRKSVQLIKGRG
jgi:hypothetical protein